MSIVLRRGYLKNCSRHRRTPANECAADGSSLQRVTKLSVKHVRGTHAAQIALEKYFKTPFLTTIVSKKEKTLF